MAKFNWKPCYLTRVSFLFIFNWWTIYLPLISHWNNIAAWGQILLQIYHLLTAEFLVAIFPLLWYITFWLSRYKLWCIMTNLHAIYLQEKVLLLVGMSSWGMIIEVNSTLRKYQLAAGAMTLSTGGFIKVRLKWHLCGLIWYDFYQS